MQDNEPTAVSIEGAMRSSTKVNAWVSGAMQTDETRAREVLEKVRKLTMPNGDVLECEYPDSMDWAKSWSIRYPDTGEVGTTGEQDWEIVETYGLTAIANALLAFAAPPAVERVKDLWQNLLDKDDRTSPEEYPDHALITFDEFADYVARAKPSPTLHPSDREAIARVIDPPAFSEAQQRLCPGPEWQARQNIALAKADAILALSGSLAPANPTEKGE